MTRRGPRSGEVWFTAVAQDVSSGDPVTARSPPCGLSRAGDEVAPAADGLQPRRAAPRRSWLMVNRERGHRVLPHTADVILEAWGPDFASCAEEAVAALASVYVDARRADTVERRKLHLGPGSEESLLLEVLEEVIFTLDTAEDVLVRAEVTVADDAGLDVVLSLAERRKVRPTGSVPKAVSRSELVVDSQAGWVRCRFLVDV